jgi:hypothetical protein
LFSLVVVELWKNDRQRDYFGFLALNYGPINVGQYSRRRHVEASMLKSNEWDLLKRQFDALVHDESGVESIEKIFDVQFSRRFTELINQTAESNSRTGYIDWSRR